MAGLGRKVWNAGEVLAAADVNGYLMDQTVMYFASASARSAALPTPDAGMHTYRADGTVVEVWNGSAWVSANSVGGSVSPSQISGSIPGSQISGTVAAVINNANVINTITASTANSYTVQSADQGVTLRFTAGSAVAVTVSTATAFTAGQRVDVLQDGAGTVSIVAGSGVTFGGRGTAGTAYALSQFEAASVLCVASNTYRIIGNVSAV